MVYNIFSRYFGKFASKEFPKGIQNFLNTSYVKLFKIDLSDFEVPEDGFKSLNELFTRKLKNPREIDVGFVSPSDGIMVEHGIKTTLNQLKIKNNDYDVKELLGDLFHEDDFSDGFEYANIYLSPSDYHHYHSPIDMEITEVHYIKGTLYTVSPNRIINKNVYSKNERVVIKAVLPNKKPLWMVLVGALNVGKIKLDFDNRIQTNSYLGDSLYYYNNLFVKKGEHLGNFELGSTIILISKKNTINYNYLTNKKVFYGRTIGNLQ